MKLAQLKRLLMKTGKAVEVPSQKDIHDYEIVNKIKFPKAYTAFLSEYGSGIIEDFLTVWNPVSRNRFVNLKRQMDTYLNAFRMLMDVPEAKKFCGDWQFYPSEGGLLPFAGTENGDFLFWRTKGKPDEWSIVVWSRAEEINEFDLDLIDFLVLILKDKRASSCLSFLAEGNAKFIPLKIKAKACKAK